MSNIPKRCCFRYSLRTLFVVVTVMAVCLGYPLNWIYQRHKLLDNNAALIASMDLGHKLWDGHTMRLKPPAKPPAILGLFGEPPVDELTVVLVVDKPPFEVPADVQRAKRLFPEAEITWSFVDRNGDFFPSRE